MLARPVGHSSQVAQRCGDAPLAPPAPECLALRQALLVQGRRPRVLPRPLRYRAQVAEWRWAGRRHAV